MIFRILATKDLSTHVNSDRRRAVRTQRAASGQVLMIAMMIMIACFATVITKDNSATVRTGVKIAAWMTLGAASLINAQVISAVRLLAMKQKSFFVKCSVAEKSSLMIAQRSTVSVSNLENKCTLTAYKDRWHSATGSSVNTCKEFTADATTSSAVKINARKEMALVKTACATHGKGGKDMIQNLISGVGIPTARKVFIAATRTIIALALATTSSSALASPHRGRFVGGRESLEERAFCVRLSLSKGLYKGGVDHIVNYDRERDSYLCPTHILTWESIHWFLTVPTLLAYCKYRLNITDFRFL